MIRIATWNIERPRNDTGLRSQRILSRLLEVKADIWILTETHDAVTLGADFHSSSTPTITASPIFHQEGEHKTTIWSRWPIIEIFKVATPHRATCIILETPLSELVVYGTVLPCHGARWPYGTPRNWDAHYAAIATQGADWTRLRRGYPLHGFCLAGDLNQTRTSPYTYGTKWVRALLDLALKESGLVGVTQTDFPMVEKLPTEEKELLAGCIDHNVLMIVGQSGWGEWASGLDKRPREST